MAETGEPAEEGHIDKDTDASDEKLTAYKNAFAVFDKDGSGSISADELKQVLISLGKNPTDQDVETMIAGVDEDDIYVDSSGTALCMQIQYDKGRHAGHCYTGLAITAGIGNGEIELDEFIKLMEDEDKAFKTEDLMRQAFGVLDPDGDGYITVPRLKRIVEELGIEFTDEEIQEMMSEADLDGNGTVNYRGIIGLMSTEDETLATAFEKREKIEEIKREEIAQQEAERLERERDDGERIDENIEIPDMEEIASQFDNEQYDKFSRQIPVGGRIVKRPGKKLPMSTARVRYLQRKNKSLSMDGSNGESVYGSMLSLNEQESIRSGHQQEFRTYFRPDSNHWLGTIQDEGQTFDAKFTSNQPRQYKHVESRLLDPKYYLKKPKPSNEEQNRLELANIRAISIDFKNELKALREINSRSTTTYKSYSNSNVAAVSQPKAATQSYAERAQREQQTKETKLYYAIWKTAFTKAIDRLRDNKKAKPIRLNTPELLEEQAIREEKERQEREKHRRKYPPKQTHRMSVISPSLQTSSPSIVKDSTTPRTRQILNRGSYTERLKKIHILEEKLLQKQEEEKLAPSTSPQKPRLAPLQKRGDVITRSALNRIVKIPA